MNLQYNLCLLISLSPIQYDWVSNARDLFKVAANTSISEDEPVLVRTPSYLQSLSHLLSEPQMYAILLTCMYSLACIYMYCNSVQRNV